ncbi:LamG domain-containing protein [Nocardioides donggukensis]|uniref:LamG domain-containing protein n=1 Tax=Nocardioides donggukensis TaxID=2774019 RepID=A0A927K969_9ACTN|nr:LamG domain-containing protein [Nocardioides donggukensis]MBD8870071.1 LamG domain-containing protein [Nocardioides donggukensis]
MFTKRSLRIAVAATVLGLTGASVASPAPAASYDLAGLWLFNEGGGQHTYDWSWSGNHGRLGSTTSADEHDPSWVQLPRHYWFRRAALRFDGDDHVRVADSPSLEPDGVTVVARVRAEGSPGDYRYVVAKGALSCETASYGLYTGNDGGLRFYASDGSDYTLSPSAGPQIWDGRWHTVIGSYDGTNVRLKVDGTEVGVTPADLVIGYGLPTDDDLWIGDYAGPCSAPFGFVGDVDGVAVIGTYADGVGGMVR